MIEDDFKRVKNYLNAAAGFYGHSSFDIFIEEGTLIPEKKEEIQRILRLAEFLQAQILAAEIAALEQAMAAINRPTFTFKGLRRGFLSFFD